MVNISSEKFYEFLKNNNYILFEAIVGSQAYSTNTPESDIDKKFVYILPDSLYGFIPQVQIDKDYSGFELGEFMQLLETANPTILELIAMPEDCVLYKHPIFDLILKEKDKFITKKCSKSFGGYGLKQLKKAMGQDKMMNWEKSKTIRKNPIDFCYMIDGYGSRSLKKFLKEISCEQKFCGISKIPNTRDTFALFYDYKAYSCFSECVEKSEREENKKMYKSKGEAVGFGYKGIEKEGESENVSISNDLRLSSIPKGEKVVCVFSYNKDEYTQHCKSYNKYQNWLENRNEQRWVDTESHGQVSEEKNSKIDSKNIMHLVRLLNMSREISEGKGLIIRRPDAEYLKSIRRGEVNLQTIIDYVEKELKIIEEQFENSTLPNSVNHRFITSLTEKIRTEFFKEK